MRLARPLGVILALLVGPLMLAQAGGWTGQRSFDEELGSTLGISALGVLAIVLILPTRLRVFAGLGADAAVRLHRHLVGVLLALIVGHVALAVGLQPARYALLRFFGQPWRAQAAVASVVCPSRLDRRVGLAPATPYAIRGVARAPRRPRRRMP